MAKRMLIDATHPEETRVVVLNGNKLEEFDFETSTKKQLKGNIYLAKVTRVEPSLQAAFVDYGGNRHGFLAFNEIHPDYWRIPVADREALLAEQDEVQENGEEEPPRRPREPSDGAAAADVAKAAETNEAEAEPSAPPSPDLAPVEPNGDSGAPPPDALEPSAPASDGMADTAPRAMALEHESGLSLDAPPAPPETGESSSDAYIAPDANAPLDGMIAEEATAPPAETTDGQPVELSAPAGAAVVESVGGDDDMDEVETRRRFRPLRHYKIQEVIKRRQVLLVQVVKEERGTKGAALTTYLSLAGRYCVLMPNTARGGGISRRITSAQDRKRLKSIIEELALPEGTAVILRTAGMERSKSEIKRDYEYLQRQWDDIRELTLKSTAPCLVYEEGSLIKRAIRDLYSRDIEEILVEGQEGYKAAKAFMKTLMPSHAGRIQLYNDPTVPLFQRYQVESQLDEMHSPTVRLRSGGYIVINPTEALVSIDVNSGRATRERHIEETALKTNLEAADEIARQLRLRDLAGLIVIDFIDMEDSRNQHAVERRLKEAMKSDRARIQIGRISPFGLLELSRQRLRPSLQEVSSERCPHCGGTGFVRSTESTALHVLRAIEEEGMKLRTAEAVVHVPTAVAIYILNQKRDTLAKIETRYGLRVTFSRDDTLVPPAYRFERVRARTAADPLPQPAAASPPEREQDELPPAEEGVAEAETDTGEIPGEEPAMVETAHGETHHANGDANGENGGLRRRRRRRRRGRGRDADEHGGAQPHMRDHRPHDGQPATEAMASNGADETDEPVADEPDLTNGGEPAHERPPHYAQHESESPDGGRRRRRGRRGGRRRGRRGLDQQPSGATQDPFADPRHPETSHDHAEASEPAQLHTDHRPRVIEGPGDAYDWPWNRRAERFPDEAAREDEHEAAAPQPSGDEPMPAPDHALADAPHPPEPAPSPHEPSVTAAPADETPVTALPADDPPAAPPRKGWWRRLTQ